MEWNWDKLRADLSTNISSLSKSVSEASTKVNATLNSVSGQLAKTNAMVLERIPVPDLNLDHMREHQEQFGAPEQPPTARAPGVTLDNHGNSPEALQRQVPRQLELTYITPRVVAMGFPSAPERGVIPADYAAYLDAHHPDKYMVWDMSEREYDTACWKGQRMEFQFPGHPSPPLGALFKLCTSIESWLDADEGNIAVVHCLTGKGRTLVTIACFLAWTGQAESAMEALRYTCERRALDVERATIPSQRRYVQYFGSVLDNVKPRDEPLRLRTLEILHMPIECRPYVQVYSGSHLLYSSEVPDQDQDVCHAGGSRTFQVDLAVQGDILVRCRHWDMQSGSGVSLFRVALHAGYIATGMQRFPASKLDGACRDQRFLSSSAGDEGSGERSFHVDITFSATASGAVVRQPATAAHDDPFLAGLSGGGGGGGGGRGSAGDSKFWNEIQKRKERRRAREGAGSMLRAAGKGRGEAGAKDAVFSIFDDEDEEALATRRGAGTPALASADDLRLQLAAAVSVDTGPSVAKEAEPAHKPSAARATSDVLEDLDELEKELGLSFASDVPESPAGKAVAGAPGIEVADAKGEEVLTTTPAGKGSTTADDELAELENYLADLSPAP